MSSHLTRIALLLALACAGATFGCSQARKPSAPATAIPHRDLPLGTISGDVLPLTTPLPNDLAEDERTKPYHCLVRVFSFPSLAVLDVAPELVELRGLPAGRRVAPGEYLFEQIPIALVVVGVQRVLADSGKRQTVASRNPLMLSRHSLTRCDLYVAVGEDQSASVDLKGRVVDRETLLPLAGARLKCRAANVETVTDEHGDFQFERPLRWSEALSGIGIERDGYIPGGLNERNLISNWVDRFRKDGSAMFALMPERPDTSRRRMIPTLPK